MICKSCSKEIPDDSVFCSFCGNKIEKTNGEIIQIAEDETILQQETTSEETTDTVGISQNTNVEVTEIEKSQKKKWEYIVLPILSVILLSAVVLVGQYFLSNRIIPQDINEINGCPEIYNLEFGTDVKDVSDVLEFEYTKYIAGMNRESWLEPITDDSRIMAVKDINYKIYGVRIKSILFDFNRYDLDGVMILISKDDITIDKLVKLYTKIYGNPTEIENSQYIWRGPDTEIIVDNAKTEENADDTLIVYYRAINLNFKEFRRSAVEIDPFLLRFDALGFPHENIIDKLNEGKDYSVEEFNPEVEGFPGFTKYTLYPDFQYMGLEEGMTVIQLDVGDDDSKIDVASYSFFLEKDNVVDKTEYIKSKLDEKYGEYTSCTYSSTYYDELGIKDISFDELLRKVGKQEQGMYSIQWKSKGGSLISMSLFKTPEDEYYEGDVSFSKTDQNS